MEPFSIFAVMNPRVALLVCTLLFAHANASEIHPFVRGFFPVDVSVSKNSHEVSSSADYSTGFTVEVGAEFLTGMEYAPLYFGGGIGFMSAHRDDDIDVVPCTIPIWASFSLRSPKDYYNITPYVTLRAGWPMPATTTGAWWEAPSNFMVDASAGVFFSKSVGFEASYTFTSLKKSYEHKDLSYRFSYGKIGLALFMNFNISYERSYVPNTTPVPEDE